MINIGALYFSIIETLIHELTFVKQLSRNHQKWQRSCCNEDFFCATWTEATNKEIKKRQCKGIEDLMNCALMLYFLKLIKLLLPFASHKTRPLNGKKLPFLLTCYHIFLWNTPLEACIILLKED